MRRDLFHPSLISLDNAAEEFWQDYRRKQGLPVESVSEADLIKAEVDLFETISQHSGLSPADCRESLKDALAELQARDEAAKEAQFIQDVETIRAANRRMKAAQPKSKFSWAGVIALLVVAGVVMWLTYLVIEGW